MSDLVATDELFFTRAGLDQARVEAMVSESLNGADDGELFLEYRQSESLVFDDGRLKTSSRLVTTREMKSGWEVASLKSRVPQSPQKVRSPPPRR